LNGILIASRANVDALGERSFKHATNLTTISCLSNSWLHHCVDYAILDPEMNGTCFMLYVVNYIKAQGTAKSNVYGEGKAIPLQALTGPEGSRRLRLSDFKTIGT
jgi:hypothetical protein